MHATAFLKSPGEHKIGPAAVVFGPERFLKREALRELTTLVLGDPEAMGLTRLAGEMLDLKTVVDTLLTVSMWSPRQLVVVEDADEFVSNFREGLEKYLDRPAKKSVLVLDVKSWPSNTRLAKKIAAIGLPIECTELKGPQLLGWLTSLCAERHGKKLDRQAASLLVELAGTELGLLDQELAKLAAYVGKAPAIDAAAVEKLVGGWKAETTWKMLDAARDGQLGLAIELLDKLLTSGEHPIKLLGGVNYAFRPVARAVELSRTGVPLAEALTQCGVKPFAVKPAAEYLRRIGRPRAEKLFGWLLDADLDIKGASALDEQIVIERMLVQLAGKV